MNIFGRRGRAVLRDYSRKQYRNPLFRRQLSNAKASWLRQLIVPALILAAIVGWCWFLFFSQVFQIHEITVSGQRRVQEWEIRDATEEILNRRRALIFPMRSIFMLSEEALKTGLSDRFVLESVEIQKKPPRKLTIIVKERVSSILVRMPDGAHAMLDLDGTIIRLYRPDEALPSTEAKTLQIDAQEALSLRDAPVDNLVVAAVIAAPEALEHAFNVGVSAADIHLERIGSHTLRVVTNEGWGIYFDAKQPLADQFANAELVLRTKVGDQRKRLDYIDVRFQEKVFFKLH
jgi:cell division septal protein FtsQ